MYFDEVKNKMDSIEEERQKRQQDLAAEIEAAKKELQGLQEKQNKAVSEGKGDVYTELIGEIAVASARVEQLTNARVESVSEREALEVSEAIGNEYRETAHAAANTIIRNMREAEKAIAQLQSITAKGNAMLKQYEELTGKRAPFYIGSDAYHFGQYFNKFVGPTDGVAGNHSVTAFCNCWKFGKEWDV